MNKNDKDDSAVKGSDAAKGGDDDQEPPIWAKNLIRKVSMLTTEVDRLNANVDSLKTEIGLIKIDARRVDEKLGRVGVAVHRMNESNVVQQYPKVEGQYHLF